MLNKHQKMNTGLQLSEGNRKLTSSAELEQAA